MDGYILLERADSEEDAGGECGLLIEAVYPVLGSPAQLLAPAPYAEDVGLDLAWAVERTVGFESSATATDCGGGTSEVVFDDSECGVVAHTVFLLQAAGFLGLRVHRSGGGLFCVVFCCP